MPQLRFLLVCEFGRRSGRVCQVVSESISGSGREGTGKMAEAWLDSDLESVRRDIHEICGPHVVVEFEEMTRSEFNPKQVYQILVDDIGIFKSRNERLGMVTYAVAYPSHSEVDEEYGTLEGALHRVI